MSFCEVSQIIVRLIEAKLFQPFHAYLQIVTGEPSVRQQDSFL